MTPDAQKALLGTVHFWLDLAIGIVAVILGSGIWKPGEQGYQVMFALSGVLGRIAYQLAASWSAPRQPWTPQQRVEEGLPPTPALVAPVVVSLPTPDDKGGQAKGGAVGGGDGGR